MLEINTWRYIDEIKMIVYDYPIETLLYIYKIERYKTF